MATLVTKTPSEQAGTDGSVTVDLVRIVGGATNNPDGTPVGGSPTFLPPGRAAATASVPVVLSNEDKLSLDKASGTYRRATAVSATAGDGLLITGVTTAGTVNITFGGGGSSVINVGLGTTQLPYGVTAATAGTAVGATFQSLFYV